MTPLVGWTILGVGIAIALVMIGMRNWGGWVVLVIDSVAWTVYSAVHHESVAVHIFNLIMIAITVYFAYRWGRIAINEEELRADAREPGPGAAQ
jgi:hypothetical protein